MIVRDRIKSIDFLFFENICMHLTNFKTSDNIEKEKAEDEY